MTEIPNVSWEFTDLIFTMSLKREEVHRMAKSLIRNIDWTKMALGTTTRTFKGERVAWIGTCPKCGKRGERSVFLPELGAARGGSRPHVSYHHTARPGGMEGFRYLHITESCTLPVNAETVDDLLNVPERKHYDAWKAELQKWVDAF